MGQSQAFQNRYFFIRFSIPVAIFKHRNSSGFSLAYKHIPDRIKSNYSWVFQIISKNINHKSCRELEKRESCVWNFRYIRFFKRRNIKPGKCSQRHGQNNYYQYVALIEHFLRYTNSKIRDPQTGPLFLKKIKITKWPVNNHCAPRRL